MPKKSSLEGSITSPESYDLTEYENESIEQTGELISEIVRQLRTEIEHGEYIAVIGDDSSGRIPTLMMSEVLDKVYEKRGFPRVTTRFIAGNSFLRKGTQDYTEHRDRLDPQMQRIEKDSNNQAGRRGRALVVTDMIASGDTMDVFVDSLKAVGWEFDIAALTIEGLKGPFEKRWGTRVVYSGLHGEPLIFKWPDQGGGRELSGVFSNMEDEGIFAQADRKRPGHSPSFNQGRINEARALTKHIAHDIAEEFDKKSD